MINFFLNQILKYIYQTTDTLFCLILTSRLFFHYRLYQNLFFIFYSGSSFRYNFSLTNEHSIKKNYLQKISNKYFQC